MYMNNKHKEAPNMMRVTVYLTEQEYWELESYRRLYKIKAKMKVAYTTNALIRACIKTCMAHFNQENKPNLIDHVVYKNEEN